MSLAPWGSLHAACNTAAKVHATPVLLLGAEVVLGRTVALNGGVCVPLAQVSSNHCRFLPGGQGPDAPLAWVVDTSTNGTFLNSLALERNKPQPLCDGDLLCLASPDLTHEKTVAFYFRKPEEASEVGNAPSTAKRPRRSLEEAPPPPHDAALAAQLHGSNTALRQQLAAAEAALRGEEKARVTAVAAVERALEAVKAELDEARRKSRNEADEQAALAAAAAAAAASRERELAATSDGAVSRTAAAEEAAQQAEAQSVAARAERDGAISHAREAEAALDTARAALRAEKDAAAKLRAELAAKEAALEAAHSTLLHAQGRAERSLADAEAAQQALAAERLAHAASAAAAEAAGVRCAAAEAEAAVAREEARTVCEGGELGKALTDRLVAFVRTTAAQAAQLLSTANALEAMPAAAGAQTLPESQALHPGRGTQRLMPPPSTAPAGESVPPDMPEAQLLGGASDMCLDAPSLLRGSVGIVTFPEPRHETPRMGVPPAPLSPPLEVDEDGEPPSASMQVEIDMVREVEAARRLSQLPASHAF